MYDGMDHGFFFYLIQRTNKISTYSEVFNLTQHITFAEVVPKYLNNIA